jgi:hypothetical protein
MSVISAHTKKGETIVRLMNWKSLENYDTNKYNKFINSSRVYLSKRNSVLEKCMQNDSCKNIVKEFAVGKEKVRFYLSRIMGNKLWDITHNR